MFHLWLLNFDYFTLKLESQSLRTIEEAVITQFRELCQILWFIHLSFSCPSYSLCHTTIGLETLVCRVVSWYGQNIRNHSRGTSPVWLVEELRWEERDSCYITEYAKTKDKSNTVSISLNVTFLSFTLKLPFRSQLINFLKKELSICTS